jgi:hypothetical protein
MTGSSWHRILAGALVLVALPAAACTPKSPARSTPATASVGGPTRTPAQLPADPCGLATLDEVSAAFAAPAHVNAGDNSSQAKRSCLYLDGPSDTATGAISILVLRVPDLAPDWFANRVASRECAKPVSGLGERAYSCVDPGHEAYVETLTGALIVTVSYHWQGKGTASTDLASYLPRLVPLATAVIERL